MMAFGANLSSDRFSFSIFLFCVLSILAAASLILVSIGKLPPQIPLFYSRPWGETMLAPGVYLWILPLVATLSVTVNFITGDLVAAQNKQGFSTNKFLARILTVFSLLVCLTILYTEVKIISLLI